MDGTPSLPVVFSMSFLLAFSGALMPGPLLAATIADSMRRGAAAGPLLTAGHALPELVLVGLVACGLAPFVQAPTVVTAVFVLGGLLLIAMGIDMLRSGYRPADVNTPAAAAAIGNPLLRGAVLSVSNPYWTVWWVTLGVGPILAALQRGWGGVAVFYAGHILGDLAWYAFVSAAVARGRNVLGSRGFRVLILGCAVALTAFGIKFLADGIVRMAG